MKFNIFDTVYFMHSDKVHSGHVVEILDNGIYEVEFGSIVKLVSEDQVYLTKKELIDSL